METIKNIAAIIGCILSVISLITIFSKGGRAFIKSVFQKNTKDLHDENKQQSSDIKEIKETVATLLQRTDVQDEVLKQNCRNVIKDIYYKYCKTKKIPLYERKTADREYDIYNKIYHGNSYASLLYGEICKWEIDTVSYQDLAED